MTVPPICEVFAAIADRFPDRPCVIAGTGGSTYAELARNSGSLARFFADRGISIFRERAHLEPWESGQAHVGLLMYNCATYLEAELAATMARAVAININYRYVAEELVYLFRDARLKALVFHSGFAATVAAVAPRIDGLDLLIQVPDESGGALLPGAVWYRDALAIGAGGTLDTCPSPDDLHILYTGGTTGMPKGVMWRQADILVAGLGGRKPGGTENALADFLHSAGRTASRTLPAGPFMHASGRWTALSQMMLGNVIVLPRDTRRFAADDIWQTVEREKVVGLNIVGDAMAQPLLAELERASYDLASLRAINSGAAVLSQTSKDAFLRRLPDIAIVDTVGSSETGPQAAMMTGRDVAGSGHFGPAAGTTILTEDLSGVLPPGADQAGWLARSGRVPLGYLGDAAKTRKAFVLVGGVRYAVPGDRARWSADGRIHLLGRDSSTINSGGEKIYAEEVEIALKHHAAVADAVVCGRPSERWGEEVVAIVALRPGLSAARHDLLDEAARHVARYKLPKHIVYVSTVERTITGKPRYDWAREIAAGERELVEMPE